MNELRRKAYRKQAEEMACKNIARVLDQLPKWDWCCVGDPKFARVVDPQIQKLSKRWTPGVGSILILALSGTGKTAGTRAGLVRHGEQALTRLLGDHDGRESRIAAEKSFREFCQTVWTTPSEIGWAMKEHRLGSERPDLVRRCVEAPILVLDELGPEPANLAGLLFDIVRERNDKGLPTIVTSGLTASEFRSRYGDAMWRRLTQDGIGNLIDLHSKGSDAK